MMTVNSLASQQVKLPTADLDRFLSHPESFWESIRNKRLFVTGGTGFFGCWLLEILTRINERFDLGASALVLTRDLEGFRRKAPHLASNPAIQFHIGDVRDFAFPEGIFSHIIHAATPSDAKLNRENPLLMFDTIVEGTRHTLDFSVHCGAEKFLLTSSGAVYGKQPSGMTHISEDYGGAPDPTDPNSAYAEGKRAAEFLCALYSGKYGVETKIARCFAFIGPCLPLDMHYAAGNFIRDGLSGGPIIVKGDGTPYRSYLYAADLAIWLWTILFNGKSCRPYNVGSEDAVTIAELANTVAKCFKKHIDVKIANSSNPNNPAERYVPLTKRVREELSVRQTMALEESIEMTIASFR